MKSSTLSLVQWDFTSFLLGGFTAATIHSKRLRLFQLTRSAFFGWWWPNDNRVNCHMVSPKFGMPPTCGNSMFLFFVMVKLMVFYGRFWHSTQSRKVFSPPDSFPCGIAGDGTISPVIPMAPRLLASRDIPSQKKNMYISISLHNIRYMYMYIYICI